MTTHRLAGHIGVCRRMGWPCILLRLMMRAVYASLDARLPALPYLSPPPTGPPPTTDAEGAGHDRHQAPHAALRPAGARGGAVRGLCPTAVRHGVHAPRPQHG